MYFYDLLFSHLSSMDEFNIYWESERVSEWERVRQTNLLQLRDTNVEEALPCMWNHGSFPPPRSFFQPLQTHCLSAGNKFVLLDESCVNEKS